MTENIWGWVVIGVLVILLVMAVFHKAPVKRHVQKTRIEPQPDKTGQFDFLAGFENGIDRYLSAAASTKIDHGAEDNEPEDVAFVKPQLKQVRNSIPQSSAKQHLSSTKPAITGSPKIQRLSGPKNLTILIFVAAVLLAVTGEASAITVQRSFTGDGEHTVYQPFDQGHSDPIARSQFSIAPSTSLNRNTPVQHINTTKASTNIVDKDESNNTNSKSYSKKDDVRLRTS